MRPTVFKSGPRVRSKLVEIVTNCSRNLFNKIGLRWVQSIVMHTVDLPDLSNYSMIPGAAGVFCLRQCCWLFMQATLASILFVARRPYRIAHSVVLWFHEPSASKLSSTIVEGENWNVYPGGSSITKLPAIRLLLLFRRVSNEQAIIPEVIFTPTQFSNAIAYPLKCQHCI